MEYLKRVFTKKQIIWLVFTAIALILFLIILGTGVRLSRSQPVQNGAARWDSAGGHAQISVFFSELAEFSEDNIKELNFNIDKVLDKESLTAGAGARRRISAYSSLGKVTVNAEKGSQTVKTIGVGGDFFLLHPVKMESGSYFDGEDVMQDKVILDTDTAWHLFGSYDVVGRIVEIGGMRHLVSGVYRRDEGRLNDLAGNNEATIYMTFESLSNFCGVTGINCYETILPNPVSGFAMGAVKDGISVDENRFDIIENSKRFNWVELMKNAAKIGSRSMNSKSVVFPYWENMARGLEDLMTPLAVTDVFLFAFIVINLLVLAIRMWTLRGIHSKDVKDFVERKIEKAREKKKATKTLEGGEYL